MFFFLLLLLQLLPFLCLRCMLSNMLLVFLQTLPPAAANMNGKSANFCTFLRKIIKKPEICFIVSNLCCFALRSFFFLPVHCFTSIVFLCTFFIFMENEQSFPRMPHVACMHVHAESTVYSCVVAFFNSSVRFNKN